MLLRGEEGPPASDRGLAASKVEYGLISTVNVDAVRFWSAHASAIKAAFGQASDAPLHVVDADGDAVVVGDCLPSGAYRVSFVAHDWIPRLAAVATHAARRQRMRRTQRMLMDACGDNTGPIVIKSLGKPPAERGLDRLKLADFTPTLSAGAPGRANNYGVSRTDLLSAESRLSVSQQR